MIGNDKQWGPDGVLVSEVNPDDMLFETQLEQVIDSYYVWTRTSVNPATFGQLNVWAKLMAADGSTAEGWSDYGVVTSNYSDWDTNQYLPKAAVTDAGLFIGWLDFRSDFIKNLYGQMISTTGSVMWNPSGVPLQDFGREQDELSVLGDSLITFAWKEAVTGSNQDIAIQQYTTSGTPIGGQYWGETGYYVADRDTTQSSPNLAKFFGNGMIVAYEDYSNEDANIYCKFIEANGQMLEPSIDPGVIVCDEIMIQQYPICAVLNEDNQGSAVIVWSDGRSSGKEPIFGLYAQKIHNITTGNNDDNSTVMLPGIRLEQNYPNPFNPDTKISFSLQNSEKHLELAIYNIKGQKVKELYSGKAAKGNYSYIWDGTDHVNNGVASGVYFCKLSSGNKTQTRKMVLMK
jgi:hypothetical protein